MSADADDVGPHWAQPLYRGRPLVVALVAVSALIAVLLLLPVPDDPRRWVVLGLLGVLLAIQVVLGVRTWRAGRRPLSPLWMRVTAPTAFMWGAMTSWPYALPIGFHESALASLLNGAGIAVFFGFVMWLGDQNRPDLRSHRTDGTTKTGPVR